MGIAAAVGAEVVAQRRDAHLLLRHVVQQVVHLPGVAGVERPALEEVQLLGLGQHEQVGLRAPQLPHRFAPEIDGDEHRHVAAESVDGVLLEPVAHGVDLALPYGAVGVVEFGRVGPVPGDGRLALRVAFVPIGRLLGDPARVAGRVVGHPVEQHLHAEAVRFGHEGVQIGRRSHLGIHGAVVAYGVVGAEGSLAVDPADGVDGHQPYGVDPQFAQKGQTFRCGAQRALGR